MPDTRFMADHMAIKLGKYLRILGYDADWDKQVRTHALIARANAERRVFLTCNRHLAEQFPAAERFLILKDPDPVRQLRVVMERFGLDPYRGLFSRCVRCNVTVVAVEHKDTIRDRVHPNVFARHETFFTCPVCDAVFWRGSHVRNTCRKLGLEDNRHALGNTSG